MSRTCTDTAKANRGWEIIMYQDAWWMFIKFYILIFLAVPDISCTRLSFQTVFWEIHICIQKYRALCIPFIGVHINKVPWLLYISSPNSGIAITFVSHYNDLFPYFETILCIYYSFLSCNETAIMASCLIILIWIISKFNYF